ncbi:MAG: peptidylprolyl isomerase [Candidatus Methylacidiphilales bacterium]
MDAPLYLVPAIRPASFRRTTGLVLAIMAALMLTSSMPSCLAQAGDPAPLTPETAPVLPPSGNTEMTPPPTTPASTTTTETLSPAPAAPTPEPSKEAPQQPASAPAAPPAPDVAAGITDKENLLFLNTTQGRIVIHMRPDLAPLHIERIKELVRKKFYNGKIFHRVIEGFIAQGGDPEGTGRGGSGQRIQAEFTNTPFTRGVLGMARIPDDPNSADSQFFICYRSIPDLNGQYTVWGEVVAGMEVAESLAKGEPPSRPDSITTAEMPWDKPPVPLTKKEKAAKEKAEKDKLKLAAGGDEAEPAPKAEKKDSKKTDPAATSATKPGDVPTAQPVTPVDKTKDKEKDKKKAITSTPSTIRPTGTTTKATSANSKGR